MFSQRGYALPLLAVIFPALRESVAFGPQAVLEAHRVASSPHFGSKQQRRDGGALKMVVDPQEAIHHVQMAAGVMEKIGGSIDHATSHATDAFTTITAASEQLAMAPEKHYYTWQFLWFHGDELKPVPNPDWTQLPKLKSFIGPDPNLSPEDMEKWVQAQKEAFEIDAPWEISGFDPAKGGLFDTSGLLDRMPGGKPEVFFDTPTNRVEQQLNQVGLTVEDLDEIAHDGDILSRLPMVAFASVLIDFFFFNSGNDIYRDEIENDEDVLRAEWVAQVAPRLGIGVVMAMLTIWSSYAFYHPIPGL